MSLLRVAQHTAEDLAAWDVLERHDRRRPTKEDRGRVHQAIDVIADFRAVGPCYVGVSWGKDSVVVAHLAWALAERGGPCLPLVWMRVPPADNPHCVLVRDAFLDRWPMPYHEVVVPCPVVDGEHHYPDDAQGFLAVERVHGERYISGIRGDESARRRRRMRYHGTTTRDTCAPIGEWSGLDVFAHIAQHDLPVHPAYAMTSGGVNDRVRIRVDAIESVLGGDGVSKGSGHGRLDWERRYYGSHIDAVRAEASP